MKNEQWVKAVTDMQEHIDAIVNIAKRNDIDLFVTVKGAGDKRVNNAHVDLLGLQDEEQKEAFFYDDRIEIESAYRECKRIYR